MISPLAAVANSPGRRPPYQVLVITATSSSGNGLGATSAPRVNQSNKATPVVARATPQSSNRNRTAEKKRERCHMVYSRCAGEATPTVQRASRSSGQRGGPQLAHPDGHSARALLRSRWVHDHLRPPGLDRGFADRRESPAISLAGRSGDE